MARGVGEGVQAKLANILAPLLAKIFEIFKIGKN
jgi:hypothetical protein